MATSGPAIMGQVIVQALQKKGRKISKECQYNSEEWTILGKYKEEYRKKTTHEDRDILMRNHILVDIFNYWYQRKTVRNLQNEKFWSEQRYEQDLWKGLCMK